MGLLAKFDAFEVMAVFLDEHGNPFTAIESELDEVSAEYELQHWEVFGHYDPAHGTGLDSVCECHAYDEATEIAEALTMAMLWQRNDERLG